MDFQPIGGVSGGRDQSEGHTSRSQSRESATIGQEIQSVLVGSESPPATKPLTRIKEY